MKKERYIISDRGCWEWQLYRAASGYGKVTVNGKILYAHRYYYEKYKGNIPSGMVVMHLCDNRCCVNPEHLRVGTQKENVLDISLKGRRNDKRGEDNYRAEYSDYEVEVMRLFHEHKVMKQVLIAKCFGISKTNLNQILQYKKRRTCQTRLQQKQNLLKLSRNLSFLATSAK